MSDPNDKNVTPAEILFEDIPFVLAEEENLVADNAFKERSITEKIKKWILRAGAQKDIEILIDSTETSRTKFTSGIQRVVKKLIANLPETVVIGKLENNTFTTNNRMSAELRNQSLPLKESKIDMASVRNLVLLDSSWAFKKNFEDYIQNVQKGGGKIFSVIYDLIPIRYSEVMDNYGFNEIFTDWHDMVLQKADHVMCISKAVADDVIAYYQEQNFKREKPLAVSYFPLGANLSAQAETINPKFVRKCLQRFFTRPTFLMVGTLEPRKGHKVALEAVTKLLDAGKDINLLIIGRNGWNNDELINYITRNKYNRTHILWLEDASDDELAWAYQHASCLIAASLDEGYGLPLIEGAMHGMPIICSDIPVFREVSQGYANFFKVFDADALASCIEEWLKSEDHPDSGKMKIYTWKEAADIFMEIVEGKREPYQVIQ